MKILIPDHASPEIQKVIHLINEFMDFHQLDINPLADDAICHALLERRLSQRELEQFALMLKLYRLTGALQPDRTTQ